MKLTSLASAAVFAGFALAHSADDCYNTVSHLLPLLNKFATMLIGARFLRAIM